MAIADKMRWIERRAAKPPLRIAEDSDAAAGSPARDLQHELAVQTILTEPPALQKYPRAARMLLPLGISAALWIGIIVVLLT
jgi:hypothetical protein